MTNRDKLLTTTATSDGGSALFPRTFSPLSGPMARMFPQPMFEPEGKGGAGGEGGEGEGGEGEGGAGDGDANDEGGEDNADGGDDKDKGKGKKDGDKDKGKKKPSDEEARLLREVMEKKNEAKKLKDQLKAFEGIDPEKARTALAAEKERETKELEAKGEWDKLKTQMAEENGKIVTKKDEEISGLKGQIAALAGQVEELTIGQAFSNSNVINKDLVIPPSKARLVYGPHFDFEDGKVVAFDKPRGVQGRTKLVDAQGNAVDFDAALTRLVEADPDRDSLLRSKAKPGAGSGKGGEGARHGAPDKSDKELSGRDLIAATLTEALAGGKSGKK